MIIALDAMGGDNAPEVNVIGARDALALYPQIEQIILVGDEEVLRASCAQHGLSGDRHRIEHAPEVVEMHESGAKAVRRKRQSSISVANDLVKQGQAHAVVSAGNTGAAVAAATIKLRLLKGVDRAGIASPIPNEHGTCNILDAGANPEAKAKHLATYAVMGSVYAHNVLGVQRPVVGIMSNGEEEEKGTTLTKEALVLLRHMVESGRANFDFRGNVEGHDLFETRLDVCLCDGFTGNVVLKSCEATAKAMSKWLKKEFKRNPFRVLGALLSKGAFGNVKERTNYETYGGSPLLGVRGTVIISHGSSTSLAIRNALHMAAKAVVNEVNHEIEAALHALTLPPAKSKISPENKPPSNS
ncbi:phosphate acyltransferase PlsX [Roseibacillus ishigakijimensis]|uniref:Phosphate acyltransferase n=1 Tax=Roseibacillus ishigakijimensis TaxID=454146 RepID=A0A934RQS5_9BACT|nr:phosphate acyltransferase PlsX [Roseibacillus ishigakijimensis]MBK1835240.1 phosphate acyltransferase PlsX [Roseibacillus ishigakijimensis]